MATPTIASVSKSLNSLHAKIDAAVAAAEAPAWWKSHLGWAVACVLCFALGLLF